MKPNFETKRILYACDKCCTKLSRKGELCHRCHAGRGIQIDPVPNESNNVIYTAEMVRAYCKRQKDDRGEIE